MSKVISCFAVVCLCGIPTICTGQDDFSSKIHLQHGVKEILSGPDNRPRADTYYLIAMAQSRKAEYEQAMSTIARGLSIEPRHLGLLNLRGAVFARTGRINEAVTVFRSVLRIAPDDTYAKESLRALIPPAKRPPLERPGGPPKIGTSPDAPASPIGNQGGSSSSTDGKNKTSGGGAPTSASSDAQTSTGAGEKKVLESSYFDGIKAKQRCFQSESAIKRAQESFEKTKPDAKGKLNIDDLVGAKLLPAAPVCPEGGAYSWTGGAPSCTKHGAYAQLEAEVNTVFADFNRGMTAKFSRNFPAALNAFEQVIVLYPRWAEAHFQLGDTLFRLGDDRKSIDEIRVCLKLDPSHLDGKLLLANLYFKVGHKEASLELLDAVTKSQTGGIYGLSARSIASAIRSGRNYYQIFPPY
ncbi:MAG: tetratricopeptide repeat protein [Candidatus Ozemobacteraceae bacterium]